MVEKQEKPVVTKMPLAEKVEEQKVSATTLVENVKKTKEEQARRISDIKKNITPTAPTQDLGTVKVLGKELPRNTLHQDPFKNMHLGLEFEERLNDMNAKLEQAKKDRLFLKNTVID